MCAKIFRFLAVGLALVSIAACSGWHKTTVKKVAQTGGPTLIAGEAEIASVAAEEPGEDVLAEVLAANGPKAPKPPTEFRVGHVTPRQLEAKRIQRQDRGFTISLPAGAPVTTPTVYGDLVLVGGGFRSKEFYAFNAKTGDLVWGRNLDDDGPSSAVAEDGVVVFNTESCTIFALDVKTGEHLWSWWLGDPLTSTPTIAGGRVFASYPAGQWAAQAGGHSAGANIQQQVAQQVNNSLSNAPVQAVVPQQQPSQLATAETEDQNGDDAADPKMPSRPYTHVLAAFDLRTGKILWQRWIDSDVMSAPVAVGKELIAATFSGTVYKLDQKTGKFLSARRSRATSAPVVAGGDLFFTQRADDPDSERASEAMVAQDNESGDTRFQSQAKQAVYLDKQVQQTAAYKTESLTNDAANGFGGGAPPAANHKAAEDNIGQGNVSSMQAFQGSRILNRGRDNFATMGDEVVCTDTKTGKRRWAQKLGGDLKRQGGFLGTSPAAAGDSLFVATLEGQVLQLDPKSGDVEKTYQVGSPVRAQPAIVDGRVYVGTADGKLVVIDTGDRSLTGWTTWGGDSRHSGTVD